MQHRFRFLAKHDSSLKFWTIEGDELFHLRKVLRLNLGAELEVFSLDGQWGVGVLIELTKELARVEVSKAQNESVRDPKIGLALGVLQQQTMADLIPCLVELGIDELHVFLQEGTARARLNEKITERWNKIALSSMKQCKRARPLLIQTWSSFEDCFEGLRSGYQALCFLDPEGAQTLSDFKLERGRSTCLLLGSEKGLSSKELALLQNARIPSASLGDLILRSFTAAIAGASVLASKRESLVDSEV